jgi:hypothetical protein
MQVTPVTTTHSPASSPPADRAARWKLFRRCARCWGWTAACLRGLVLVSWLTAPPLASAPPPSRIAPLFQYGPGCGAFGGVAVAPPLVLSEAEARRVIQDEATRAGIAFAPDGHSLARVELPLTDPASRVRRTQLGALTLDGYEAGRHLAYEYVSVEDFRTWERTAPRAASPVARVDLLGAAHRLRESLVASKPAGAFAVFYDPFFGEAEALAATSVVTIHGASMVPLRLLAGWLGFAYREKERTLMLNRDGETITLTVNSAVAMRNQQRRTLGGKVLRRQERILVPLDTLSLLGVRLLPTGASQTWTIIHPTNGETFQLLLPSPSEPGRTATPPKREVTPDQVRLLSTTALRLQIRDVFAWLVAEGVI